MNNICDINNKISIFQKKKKLKSYKLKKKIQWMLNIPIDKVARKY